MSLGAVGICGPMWPRRFSLIQTPNGLELSPASEPMLIDASTLGEALEVCCAKTDATVRACDGSDPRMLFATGETPRFFVHVDAEHGEDFVDIHVTRRGESICCKQRLDFELEEGDVIELGVLAF